MTPVEQITALYIGYFGRAPEPAGLNYWVGRLADGFSLAEIAESFSVQPEATSQYPYLANPNIASADTFIMQVYMNLFNRAPDAAGAAYWKAQLEGGADVGAFILDVISGAQGVDQVIIDNKIEVGVDFALEAANQPGFVYDADAANAAEEVINGVDETDASVAEGKAETDAFLSEGPEPTNIVLENVVETVVGTAGDDVISGVIDPPPLSGTFNTGDSINGGAGDDVLSIIVAGGANIIPSNISNVETIRVQALNGAAIDLSNATGVQTLEENNGVAGVTFNNVGNLVEAAFTDSNGALTINYDASVVQALQTRKLLR